MKYYFAPMEGVTGYIYRRAHHSFFNQVDKYYTPFIVANMHGKLKTREMNDILPENNDGMVVIPQILANHAFDFIRTEKDLKELGYTEVNLNLGCPARTVVSKGRGSGFLTRKEELKQFFDEIFDQPLMDISVKTRIGVDDPEEFYDIMDLYNQYPIKELIIHPRVQKDFYKNTPNLDVFADALKMSKIPICYNGDIFTPEDFKKFKERFPTVDTIMLGRGLIANPSLIHDIESNETITKQTLKNFINVIYNDYEKYLSGNTNVLYKMKELWFYMIHLFPDNEKFAKKIRKATKLADYDEVVTRLFEERDILPGAGFHNS